MWGVAPAVSSARPPGPAVSSARPLGPAVSSTQPLGLAPLLFSPLLVFLFLHLPLLFFSSRVSSIASPLLVFLFLHLPLLFSCFQTCLMAFAWHVTILVLPAICVWVGRRRVMVMISYRGEWWIECQV